MKMNIEVASYPSTSQYTVQLPYLSNQEQHIGIFIKQGHQSSEKSKNTYMYKHRAPDTRQYWG